MFKRLAIDIILILFILASCKKSDTQEKRYPRTPQEIEESIKETNFIAAESSPIVESAISEAYNQNGFLDPFKVAKKIELIPGVKSAIPTPSGTAIVIMQDDSTFNNLLLVSQDDDRLFKESSEKSINITSNKTYNSIREYIVPIGSRKALILAPFQNPLTYVDVDEIAKLLRSAGYTVDQFINSEATLDRFRGSFLDKYDIVFIATHGKADLKTHNGVLSTMLLTGEEYTDNRFSLLSEKEQNYVGIYGPTGSKKRYFALSVPWLKATIGENFTNSWIFACACESSMDDTGTGSLSKAFLDLGAGGYNGFDAEINTQTANSVAVLMTDKFTSGLSFSEASDQVRSNSLLLIKTWLLRIQNTKEANVKLFDNKQISAEPFYLVHPPKIEIPSVTTKIGNDIQSTSVSVGGDILADGGSTVTELGVFWGTLQDPEINGTKVKMTSLTESFTYNLASLSPGVTYYVRAYAINSVGTGYGNQISFTTIPISSLPTVTTNPATSVGTSNAVLNGTINANNQTTSITFEYGKTSAYGQILNANPYTLTGNLNTDVTIELTGLSENTIYHFRVTAANSTGTTNGEDMLFTTSTSTSTTTVTDFEGNVYKTILLGTQSWMSENLRAAKYNDGTPLPNEIDNNSWMSLATPAYCWYNNDMVTYKGTYGAMYNWFVVDAISNGGKNVCPLGWHIPTDNEWTTLTDFLTNNNYGFAGNGNQIGKSMAATSGWTIDLTAGNVGNDQASNNSSGFTALPGGVRQGVFIILGNRGGWWSSTSNIPEDGGAWGRTIFYNNSIVDGMDVDKRYGYSVRCLKD